MPTSEKTVAIVQSSYIPWKGYFDLIALADEFILLDDVQYTTRDWRNRNRIKTPDGLKWLTIPVRGPHRRRIDEIEVADAEWAADHWRSLRHNYAKAPYFDANADRIEGLYRDATARRLSAVNRHFIAALCETLEIETPIHLSTDYEVEGTKAIRLLNLCLASGATRYLSGPAARSYLDTALFEAEGIEVEWMSYDGYPEYPQLHPPFEHGVTILDLIFNTGPDAGEYMKGIRGRVDVGG